MNFEMGKKYDIFLSTGFIFRNVEYLGSETLENGTIFIDVMTPLQQLKSFNIAVVGGYNETEC